MTPEKYVRSLHEQVMSGSALLPERFRAAHARRVAAQMTPDGGFRAAAGAPVSDGLSTFTALVTLTALSERGVRLGDAARFMKSLAMVNGGFAGSADDEAADVEYTYYGETALGLLAETAAGMSGKKADEGLREQSGPNRGKSV